MMSLNISLYLWEEPRKGYGNLSSLFATSAKIPCSSENPIEAPRICGYLQVLRKNISAFLQDVH